MGIITWLIVLVVAGLIVSFIVNPSSFYSFKENVNDILGSFSSSDEDLNVSSGQPCLGGDFNRVICKDMCSGERLNYRTFKCIEGIAICYCKK